MKKEELKKIITESVLNFLNDNEYWTDTDDKTDKRPLFKKKGNNVFGLNKKDN